MKWHLGSIFLLPVYQSLDCCLLVIASYFKSKQGINTNTIQSVIDWSLWPELTITEDRFFPKMRCLRTLKWVACLSAGDAGVGSEDDRDPHHRIPNLREATSECSSLRRPKHVHKRYRLSKWPQSSRERETERSAVRAAASHSLDSTLAN